MNQHIKQSMAAGLFAAALVGCSTMTPNPLSSITKSDFGKTPDGQSVELYTLHNSKGSEACIMTYGGTVQKLVMPDKNGTMEDVVLGFDTLDGYVTDKNYFGALIGRYGNRIGKAQFKIDGVTYTLAKNNGENTLHGGVIGFNKARKNEQESN